jgi:hypothetical protein
MAGRGLPEYDLCFGFYLCESSPSARTLAMLVMYPLIGLSVGPSNRPLYSREYVTASGPNVGKPKVLAGLEIVLPRACDGRSDSSQIHPNLGV